MTSTSSPRQPARPDLLGVEVVGPRGAGPTFFGGGDDAAGEVPGREAAVGKVGRRVDEPALRQQGGGVAPDGLVQGAVVALDQDDTG